MSEVDHSLVELETQGMVVTVGPVGVAEARRDASYVLVDALSRAKVDVAVTVRGVLLDAAGAELGELTPQTLRIPAGGRRSFALVESGSVAHPGATTARLEIFGAVEMKDPPPVIITEGHVYDDRDRAVVSGYVVNTTDREITAVVVGGFYDDAGRLMKRPSTAFRLAAKGKRGVQLVGPDGSRSAYLFIGETVF